MRPGMGPGAQAALRTAHLRRPDPLWIEPAAGICGADCAAHPRTQPGTALQGRQPGLCLPAGSRTGSADRLCALGLARRKNLRHDLGNALFGGGGPVGSSALLGYGGSAGPSHGRPIGNGIEFARAKRVNRVRMGAALLLASSVSALQPCAGSTIITDDEGACLCNVEDLGPGSAGPD